VDHRASLPAIGRLLADPAVRALISKYGREPVTDALREAVERARTGVIAVTDVVDAASQALATDARGTLVSAINATGVVLHTNLGRAPLGEDARRAIAVAGSGYSSLELDLGTGERGSRHVHAAARLRRITGAEDALVANNAAAALLLALSALAANAPVIVSRGELVEIGGAFRIPEIVETGGARLVEVGTTNRTRIEDYRRALEADSVVLKVHRSNFAVVGFTEETSVRELVSLGVKVVYDLGSGLLIPGAMVSLDEPDVPAAVADGADVVVFSGDKLLGGPQAGIAVGKREAIQKMRKHPLMRALRAGKLVLAALDATLAVYERGAGKTLPTLAALSADVSVVRARAERLHALVHRGDVVDTVARVGGGSQPLATIPSAALSLTLGDPDAVAAELRRGQPIVIGRIERGSLLLDMRAVMDDEVDVLARELNRVL
jgi:L-seryl-tRNA(Ser) seleniumtransferase